jgi:hypothetical protein
MAVESVLITVEVIMKICVVSLEPMYLSDLIRSITVLLLHWTVRRLAISLNCDTVELAITDSVLLHVVIATDDEISVVLRPA